MSQVEGGEICFCQWWATFSEYMQKDSYCKIKIGYYLLRDMCSMDKCRNRPDKKRILLFYICTFCKSCKLYNICVYTIDNHQLEDLPHKCMQIQDVDFSIMFTKCMGHDQAFHSCSEGYNPDL